MPDVGHVVIVLDADGRRLKSSLRSAEQDISRFSDSTASSLGKWGKRAGLASAAGIGVATAAMAGLSVASIKLAATYQQSLTNAISVTGKFGDEAKTAYAEADKLATKLGQDTVFSAKQAADAMYDLASKGYDVSTWAKTMPGILNLAAATQSDLASTTELVTSTINQFTLAQSESTRVADVYTKAIGSSAATQEKLALSMSYVGPVANAVGWSLEKTVATLSRLYDAGLSGEKAGTALRFAMTTLYKPSEEAAAVMEKFGLTTKELESGGIMPLIKRLQDGKAGVGDFAQVFGTEAAPALMALKGYTGDATGSVAELEKQLYKAGGTAEQVAKMQLDTLQGQMTILKGSLETAGIAIGKVLIPGLTDLSTALVGPVNQVTTFLTGLENIEGWEGADLTGKIQFAVGAITEQWDAFETRVKAWLETGGQADLEKWGAALGEGLGQATTAIGEKAANVFLGIIGLSDDVWGQAAQAFLKGLTVGTVTGLAEGLYDVGKDIRIGYQKEMIRQVQVSLSVDPKQALEELVKAKKISEADAEALKWEIGVYVKPDKVEKQAQQAVEDLVKGVIPETPKITSALDEAIAAVDAGARGKNAADQYVDTFGNVIFPGGGGGLAGLVIGALAKVEGGVKPTARVSGGNWLFGFIQANDELAGSILHILHLPHWESHGQVTGKEYGAGIKAGINSVLSQYNPFTWYTSGAFLSGKQGGSGFGADLLAELMQNIGAAQGGLTGNTARLASIAASFGLHSISGYRPGATIRDTGRPSLHGRGQAVDVAGAPSNLWQAFYSLAKNASALGIQELLYRDKAWSLGVPYVHFNTNARSRSDHWGHLHIGSRYHAGGEVPAVLQVGERVLTADQNSFLKDLSNSLRDLVDVLRAAVNADKEVPKGGKGAAANEKILDLFGERSSLAESYISREAARLDMLKALGADLETQMAVVERQAEFIDKAVAEKAAQLQLAKDRGMSPEDINKLASELFGLSKDAADARKAAADLTQQLEDLTRVPLEQAADAWSNALSNVESIMDLVGNASNANQLLQGLFPSQLAALGGQYQSSLALMASSKSPADIMQYGSQAISHLGAMFGASKSQLDRTLDDTNTTIDKAQADWEAAWEKRGDALDEELDREAKARENALRQLEKDQRAEMDKLQSFYDQQLAAMDAQDKAITRGRTVGDLERELRELLSQQGKTAADVERIHEIREQLARLKEDYAREDARAALMAERDRAVSDLEARQEAQRIALEDQQAAADAMAEQRRQQHEQERIDQQAQFDALREQAQAAYQTEIDELVTKYQTMMQVVIDQENALLGEAGNFQAAGYTLGKNFADGLLLALPDIAAAGKAAAAQAAAYLELHSPAKLGPLANLDSWWEGFIPTLLQPFQAQDVAGPAGNIANGVQTRHLIIEGRGDIGPYLPQIIAEVKRDLRDEYDTVQWSWGRS